MMLNGLRTAQVVAGTGLDVSLSIDDNVQILTVAA